MLNSTLSFRTAPDLEVSRKTVSKGLSTRDRELESWVKRAIDVSVSFSLLAAFSLLLFPWVALLIMLDSCGNIFFKQKRTGMGGETFECLKFRTMRQPERSRGLSNAQRVTAIGSVLRKTHIDELPQLINVLRGDMSLVGPRPHMLSDTRRFSQIVAVYHHRHKMRPGITGLAQASGYFGHVESIEHLEQRIKHDLYYVENWSVMMDLRIMLKTMGLIGIEQKIK